MNEISLCSFLASLFKSNVVLVFPPSEAGHKTSQECETALREAINKKKRNFVNKIHTLGGPTFMNSYFYYFFLLYFRCKKKTKFFRVKGRFTKPPLNLESPP